MSLRPIIEEACGTDKYKVLYVRYWIERAPGNDMYLTAFVVISVAAVWLMALMVGYVQSVSSTALMVSANAPVVAFTS